MTLEAVRKDLAFLAAEVNKNYSKWRRSFNRYCNNGRRVESLNNQYGQALAYYNFDEGEDTGTVPNLNVIRSVIDAHVSKISGLKVRPFLNPVNGTFKTLKTCRSGMQFFDALFEDQDIYRKGIQCSRHSDIFERGILWLDDELLKFFVLPPWQFRFDGAEYNYGKLTRCAVVQEMYPLIQLKDKLKAAGKKNGDAVTLLEQLENNPYLKGERTIYYNLHEKERLTFAAGKLIETKPIEFDIAPAAILYFEQPLKGSQSVSMADAVYTVQVQVDSLCNKIHLAYELSPANTTWVMQGTEVKASMISNEIGAVYPFKPVPGVSSPPVIVATPPAIDPGYLPMLQFWIQQGMERLGISQLSAEAKNPLGQNPSGVALQTVEDVESDRHNPSLQAYIRLFMDAANIFIQVAPQNADVLPKKLGRARVKWSDIKRERDSYSIQFSASSSLSKDPQKKMEQIEKLIAMKVINPSLAAYLLEFPDLESAYSITSSGYDWCQRVIERAVEEENYEFFEVGPVDQLFGETVNTLLRLDANDEKPEILKRLVHLLEIVKTKMDAMDAKSQAEQQAAMAEQSQQFPGNPPNVQGPVPGRAGKLPLQGAPPAPVNGTPQPVGAGG